MLPYHIGGKRSALILSAIFSATYEASITSVPRGRWSPCLSTDPMDITTESFVL
ncbi:MAG: hypothetical protein LM581_05055 [Desulfurococcales archaeon]|nr:hypothetical protein [Desulfurococcales archaeon]